VDFDFFGAFFIFSVFLRIPIYSGVFFSETQDTVFLYKLQDNKY